jgi:hypothetical protein
MASENDRARMQAIAQAMDEANREALLEAARLPRGRNIEVALELSAIVMARGTPVEKPLPIAPVQIWREMQRRRQ